MYQAAIVSVLVVAILLEQSKALQIGFGEVDYRNSERDNGVTVVVTKQGANVGDLTVTVTPLPLSPPPVPISNDLQSDALLNDPAEFSINGRQDYDNTVQSVTFPPSTETAQRSVLIPYTNDEFNEATESFLLLARVVEATANPADIADLEYIRSGIAVAIIEDDDEIKLSFERDTYTVGEDDGELDNLIAVIKEDNVQTEQQLKVIVELNLLSGTRFATNGVDFNISSDVQTFVLEPAEQSISVPFEVFDDTIAEETERFVLSLAVAEDSARFFLGQAPQTSIDIADDEVTTFGFEFESYTAREGDGDLEVCVTILSPDEVDLSILSLASINDITTNATEDYTPLLTDQFVEIGGGVKTRSCFDITIRDDDVPESIESFELIVAQEDGTSNANVMARNAIVYIQDDDLINVLPTCGENARFVGSTCICKPGFSGAGTVCTDINECATGADNCHANARCTNTAGSYRCQCRPGYTGNGFICIDVNECAENRARCDDNARCFNTQGRYQCQCRKGFAGNGFKCTDINECRKRRLNHCHVNARCINAIGSYTCVCSHGLTGNGIRCSTSPITGPLDAQRP